MANPEHLQILEQGVAAWNKWWYERGDVRPSLRGAKLRGAKLRRAKLFGADLFEGDLHEADLAGADLRAAILNHANLVGANLRGADLRVALLKGAYLLGATLAKADLSDAHLLDANLEGANLKGANLSEANFRLAILKRTKLNQADLSGATFIHADLSGANLKGARLVSANFGNANLTGTDLSDADLYEADFAGANLEGANLTGANLALANFARANLHEADFTGVKLVATSFGFSDLSEVKGLETVIHIAPSSIGIGTIYESEGDISGAFLRGCGVPEDVIIYMRQRAMRPLRFYNSFISYSSKNQEFARMLYEDLQDNGVRCWLAAEDLKWGDKIRTALDEAIRVHEKLLLVLSKHSVASDWVEQEVETALEMERKTKRTVLFPIRLDDAVMKVKSGWPALIKNTRNIGDFTRWEDYDSYLKSFNRLLGALKAEDGRAAEGKSKGASKAGKKGGKK